MVLAISLLKHHVCEHNLALQARHPQALENFALSPGLSDGIPTLATQLFCHLVASAHTFLGDRAAVHADDRQGRLAGGRGVKSADAASHDTLLAP